MTIQKLDELTEDNIKDMSAEDLQKLALSWKDELVSARSVIWDLNKKVKGGNNWGDNGGNGGDDTPKTKEEMAQFLKEMESEKELDSFIASNPVFEEHKDALVKASKTWFFSSVEEAGQFLAEKDPTLKNNITTNQAWVGGWAQTWAETFSWKMSYADYNQLSPEEQSAYSKKSNETFGWLTFSDTYNPDD